MLCVAPCSPSHLWRSQTTGPDCPQQQAPRAAAPAYRQRQGVAQGRSLRLVVKAGLLDFFNPAAGSNKAPAVSQRAAEAAEELLQLVVPSGAGTKASSERREQIEELAQELRQFSVKNASRSKLLFGDYEVLYISAPGASGSPLLGPSGVLALSGSLPTETIDGDGAYSSSVEFKQLFFNGSFRRNGFIRPLGPDSYQLEVNETVYQAGLGGATTKAVEESFKVQVLYLSDELRIVEVSGDEDDEAVLMVLRRADIEEEEEEEEEQAAARTSGLFGGAKASQPGLATMSERQVKRQMAMEEAQRAARFGGTGKIGGGTGKLSAGTGKIGVAAAAGGSAKVAVGARAVPAAPAGGSAKVGVGAKAAAAGAAAAAAAAQEGTGKVGPWGAAKAAVRPSAPVDDVKAARAAADKKAEAEKQGAIKELLATLTETFKGRQGETKQAVAEAKEVERAGAAALKKAAAANATVDKAEAASAETEDALAEALAARKEAEVKLKEAQAALAQANNRLAALMKQAKA